MVCYTKRRSSQSKKTTTTVQKNLEAQSSQEAIPNGMVFKQRLLSIALKSSRRKLLLHLMWQSDRVFKTATVSYAHSALLNSSRRKQCYI